MNETETKSIDEMIADFNGQIASEHAEAGAEEIVIDESAEEVAAENVGAEEGIDTGTAAERGEEPPAADKGQEASEEEIDRLMAEDLAEYNRLYPDANIESYGQIPNVLKFAYYREKGLTVDEAAYLAGRGEHERKASERAADEAAARAASKSHLKASSPSKPAGDSDTHMTRAELEEARRMFPNLSDKEIASLYRRVK